MAADPHFIPPQDAAILTARWRKTMPPGGFHGGQFARVAFDNLLNQPGCAGIRIYMGKELPGAKPGPSLWTFVLVGTDADGNDMVNSSGASAADGGGGTEENPSPCPPVCGDPSPLNSPP